jgi:putative membrane protein
MPIYRDLRLPGRSRKMHIIRVMPALLFGGLATIAVGAFAPQSARAVESASGVSGLLNKANAMNYEEIEMAKLARDKAGDNQALMTLAKTLEGDHQANEDAVTALSRQQNVTLQGTPASIDKKYKRMDNLNGAEFNQAFLSDAIAGHSKALEFFEAEKAKFRGDPAVYLYVQETIPVIRAHLEMARNMEQEMGRGSDQNPANNKRESR